MSFDVQSHKIFAVGLFDIHAFDLADVVSVDIYVACNSARQKMRTPIPSEMVGTFADLARSRLAERTVGQRIAAVLLCNISKG